MLKYLIAMPTGNTIPVQTVAALTYMRRVGMSQVTFLQNSLVYDARQKLSLEAIETGADRVLFLDSDMVFTPDLMERLAADLDKGMDMVTGLYFRRTTPIAPILFKEADFIDGEPKSSVFTDYPKDSIFEVAGCGFGAVMISTQLLKDVYEKYKHPFTPIEGAFGEDVSFCYRARQTGHKIFCDSNIKVGHIANLIITEKHYNRPTV